MLFDSQSSYDRLRSMSIAIPSQDAYHRATASMFAILTPEQLQRLADLQADETLAQRLEYLSQRANEGELTDAETSEYEGYIEANNLLAVIQSEARFRLSGGEF